MFTTLGNMNNAGGMGASGTAAIVAAPLAADTATVLFRDALPWQSVAAWTHRLPTTFTDHWMDVVNGAVRGPNHRWLHHNPIDFLSAKLGGGEAAGQLSYKSYLAHIGCDVITVKGIPLLPQALHETLVSAGMSPATLYAWTHLNIVDLAIGLYSVGTGAYSLVMAITGQLPWGMETLFVTLGGAVEMGLGLYLANPLLVLGGGLKVAAGGVSLFRHLTLPEPSLLETLLPGMLGGLAISGTVAALHMAFTWNSTSATEKIRAASETIALGTVLGTLATITPWISVPLGVAYGMGKFAWSLARRIPPQSDMSSVMETIERLEGEAAAVDFKRKLDELQTQWPPAPLW